MYLDHLKYSKSICEVEFLTVADYLFLLYEISIRLSKLSTRAALYLSAAVSDYYLTERYVSEHKICSDDQEDLEIILSPVPKMIDLLRTICAPEAFLVSFKLETEDSLVIDRAVKSLKRYGHHLVVANVLKTRRQKVSSPLSRSPCFRIRSRRSCGVERLFYLQK